MPIVTPNPINWQPNTCYDVQIVNGRKVRAKHYGPGKDYRRKNGSLYSTRQFDVDGAVVEFQVDHIASATVAEDGADCNVCGAGVKS